MMVVKTSTSALTASTSSKPLDTPAQSAHHTSSPTPSRITHGKTSSNGSLTCGSNWQTAVSTTPYGPAGKSTSRKTCPIGLKKTASRHWLVPTESLWITGRIPGPHGSQPLSNGSSTKVTNRFLHIPNGFDARGMNRKNSTSYSTWASGFKATSSLSSVNTARHLINLSANSSNNKNTKSWPWTCTDPTHCQAESTGWPSSKKNTAHPLLTTSPSTPHAN